MVIKEEKNIKVTEKSINHEIDEFFEKQLDRTNYWLSFAEAKNGALLAFNVALIGVLFSLFDKCSILCTVAIVIISISIGACLVSFIPQLTKCVEVKKQTVNLEMLNLIYFEDISKLMDANVLIDQVIQKYFVKEKDEIDKLGIDLAAEVLTNSEITVRKYKIFRFALGVDLVAIIAVVAFTVVA